jgi:N-acetylmuramoyl-L-alanine amidase
MKPMNPFSRLLKEAGSGKKLFSIFIPALLWGDLFDAQAADTRRVYRPTAAQLRLEQQRREQAARIQAIRNQQKTAAGTQTQTQAVRPVQQNAKNAAATAQPAPVQVKIRYIWYKGVRFALVQDIARFYGMAISYTRSGVFLRSRRDTVTLQYDKRLAVVNRVSVYLTHPPILRGALVYLDEKDFLLGIDPLIRNAPLWKHAVKTILIDPGHGGKDQGAPGVGGLLEKNITLSLGHKTALLLRKCGYRVFMTRIGDSNLTLQQRVLMCEKLKPDLYISIHCNAVKNRRTMGIETYAATPQGAASTSDSKPVQVASAGNSFNRNNYRLAYEVHKNLLAFTRAPDRGVRHARFFVIRNAVCPAILIETGFVTHPKEGPLLNNPAYQEKLVNGIVSGIMSYTKASALPVRKLPAAQKKAVPPAARPAAQPVKPSAKAAAPAARTGAKQAAQPVKPAAKTAAPAAKTVTSPTAQKAKPAAKTAVPAAKTVTRPAAGKSSRR